MNISKNLHILLVFSLLLVMRLGFSTMVYNTSDESNYKQQGIETDKLGQIIASPDNGKSNYSKSNHKINAYRKESSIAESISYSNLPQNIRMLNNNSIRYHLHIESDSLFFEEDWRFGIFGSGIGMTGIVIADIDNDGIIEIICGGSTFRGPGNLFENFWYILEYSTMSQEYDVQWISDLYPEGISNIAGFDVDDSDTFNIFIGLLNGDIRVYDGSTLAEIGYIDSPCSSVNRIIFADADNDSENEITFCDDENLFIYDATSLSLESQIPYGADDFEVGNVDSDLAKEIILANGLVLEFDGNTTTVEWDYLGGDFGYLIELSDIDSDNMEEIIGASHWYYVTAFDADIQSPKWQIPTDLDVDALLVSDVDGDDIEDVLYGDGQWGEIHCYDAITLNEKWQINNSDHGVTDIAVFDTDDDGDLEILWGAGATSTGADHLFIHSIPTLSFEWQSQDIDGPFHAIDVGDVDSDGQQEIIIASFKSTNGYDDGFVFVFDALTHVLEWQSEENMFGGYAWTGIHDLQIGDVDDDGDQEIVIATDRLYDGAIYIINGITHIMEQSNFYDEGAPIYSLAIADIDNDGETELIAGAGREHTGAPGVYVYVINGSSGAIEWHSISLGSYWSQFYTLEVGNIDGDEALEIVAINDNIYVFDGISHQQWQSSLGGYYGLDLHDIDNDGIEEILVGTSDGNIIAIDGQSYQEELNLNVSSSPIVGLRAYDFYEGEGIKLVFSSSSLLNIYSIQDSALLWQSESLGSSAGDYNSLVVSDIDSDEFAEIVVGTNYTVVEFKESYIEYIDEEEEIRTQSTKVALFQNYPNPLNSDTRIEYILPESGNVKLSIYNIKGQLIKTLVHGFQTAGSYSVMFKAKNLNSGVYFYRINFGSYTSVRKCIVLK